MYNWIMKIIFIVSSCTIVYLMKFKSPINDTYDKKADSFNILYLVVPCAVLAMIINEDFTPTEVKHKLHHHTIMHNITEVGNKQKTTDTDKKTITNLAAEYCFIIIFFSFSNYNHNHASSSPQSNQFIAISHYSFFKFSACFCCYFIFFSFIIQWLML